MTAIRISRENRTLRVVWQTRLTIYALAKTTYRISVITSNHWTKCKIVPIPRTCDWLGRCWTSTQSFRIRWIARSGSWLRVKRLLVQLWILSWQRKSLIVFVRSMCRTQKRLIIKLISACLKWTRCSAGSNFTRRPSSRSIGCKRQKSLKKSSKSGTRGCYGTFCSETSPITWSRWVLRQIRKPYEK